MKTGVLRQMLEALAQHLECIGHIKLSECFIDSTFVMSEKRVGAYEGKIKQGTALEFMVYHSACTRPPTRMKVSLVDATLDETLTLARPQRFIGDRAYDIDALDLLLARN